jgi:hypothetical protein
VLGVEHDEVAGPAGEGIAEVVEAVACGATPVGTVAAPRAGPAAIVTAPEADIGLGEVVDAGDAFGGIGAIFAGPWDGNTPGRRDLPGHRTGGDELFTGVARFPRNRVVLAWKFPLLN